MLAVIWLCLLPLSINASDILFVNLWNSKSHARTMLPLASRLMDYGHNVTIYTQVLNSLGPLEGVNTVETVLPDAYDRSEESAIFRDLMWHSDYTPGGLIPSYRVGYQYVSHSWESESFQRIKSHKWDLIIGDEMFANPGISIALDQNARFGAKIAMFSTTDLFPAYSRLKGLWRNPIIAPNYYTRHTRCRFSPNDFYNRLITFIDAISDFFVLEHVPLSWIRKTLLRFGISEFQWSDIYSKAQVTFIDYPDRYSWPTAVSNHVIYTGSYCKGAGTLPADLEEFMNDKRKKGVIYVAFGSIVNWEWAPCDTIDKFLTTFRHFPEYNFIFSFKLAGYPIEKAGPNVKVLSWAPQKEILAHKRTVLFFTHGGLKSLKEGICSGKPLLVLPFFADQFRNAANMIHLGFAETLVKTDLTTSNMVKQIRKMLADKKYEKNIVKTRSMLLDRIVDPLEEGVFWTEKVLRSDRRVNFEISGARLSYREVVNLEMPLIVASVCYILSK